MQASAASESLDAGLRSRRGQCSVPMPALILEVLVKALRDLALGFLASCQLGGSVPEIEE